jgi:hypothetical protein
MDEMKVALNVVSTQTTEGKKIPVQTLHTGNAIFRLLNRFDHDVKDKHMTALQSNLKEAMKQIQGAFKNQFETMERRNFVMQELDKWHKRNRESGESFISFAQTHLLSLLPVGSENSNEMSNYQTILRFSEKQGSLTDEEFKQLKSAIKILCTSDDEYLFMRGKQAPPRKTILEEAIYTPPQQTI